MKYFSMSTDHLSESQDRLESWKIIASWLHCDERTAKRWEKTRGLPVHRMPGKPRSGVFARVSELEMWQGSWEQRDQLNTEPEEQLLQPQSALNVTANVASINDETAPLPVPPALIQGQRRRGWLLWAAISVAVAVAAAEAPSFLREFHTTISTTSPSLSHTPVPEAEALYFRGRYCWNLRTPEGLDKAIDYYMQAIVKDPQYAEAYAGLAETYDLLPQFGRGALASSLAKAENAANRAITLNPNLADAHAAKAFALFFLDWDIPGSDAEFRRALALDPNSALAHQWYASTLECRDDGPATLREIDAALRLNPSSAAIATDAALFHAEFGDFESGTETLKEIEQTQPKLASPASFLGDLEFAIGDFPAYIDASRQYASITNRPDDIALADAVALGWARGGKTGLLKARAEVLKSAYDHGAESGFQLGENLVLLGHPEEALPLFRASLRSRDIRLIAMPNCSWAKPLFKDPGYAAFFAEIGQQLHWSRPARTAIIRKSMRLPE